MNEQALRRLIEQWEVLANEALEQARLLSASDISRTAHYQAIMKTYLSAAHDLRALLTPPSEAAAAPVQYARVAQDEAAAVLQRAGLFARSLTLHPDGVFTAVFSRLQPISQENRVRQLSAAEARVVIVDQGTLRDSGDPYVDFAFVKA